jgi:hypothetical protein
MIDDRRLPMEEAGASAPRPSQIINLRSSIINPFPRPIASVDLFLSPDDDFFLPENFPTKPLTPECALHLRQPFKSQRK